MSSSVSCTQKVTGLASDEIESGLSKDAHFSMPLVMHNSNVHAMLKEPLSLTELAGRDRSVPLKLCSAALIPAEMKLRTWLARVRHLHDSSYDVLCGRVRPAACCQVHGGAHGACGLGGGVCRSPLGVPHWSEGCCPVGGVWCMLPCAGGGRGDVNAVLGSLCLRSLRGNGRSDLVSTSARSNLVVPQSPASAAPPV